MRPCDQTDDWTQPPKVDLAGASYDTNPDSYQPGLIGVNARFGSCVLKLDSVEDCNALLAALLDALTALNAQGKVLS